MTPRADSQWVVKPSFISWVTAGENVYYITDASARTERFAQMLGRLPQSHALKHEAVEAYYGVRGVRGRCLPWEYELMPLTLAADMLRFGDTFAEQFARQEDYRLYNFLRFAPPTWRDRAARAILGQGASPEGLAGIVCHASDDALRGDALDALVRTRNAKYLTQVLMYAPEEWQFRAYEAITSVPRNRSIMRIVAGFGFVPIAWHRRAQNYIDRTRRKR